MPSIIYRQLVCVNTAPCSCSTYPLYDSMHNEVYIAYTSCSVAEDSAAIEIARITGEC